MSNLIFTGNRLQNNHIRFLKAYNITPQQYNVLRILRDKSPSPVSVAVISKRMLDKMSNASRLVEKLRQKGYAERKECEEDRRRVNVLITAGGTQLIEQIEASIDELENPLHAITSQEAKQLNKIIDKLRG